MTRQLGYFTTAGLEIYFAITDPSTGKYWRWTRDDWVPAGKGGKLLLATEILDWGTNSWNKASVDFARINSGSNPRRLCLEVYSLFGAVSVVHSEMITVVHGDWQTMAEAV